MKKSGVSADGTKMPLILMHGPGNNYEAWKLDVTVDMRREFGFLGNVCKTNVAYVIPAVVPADYVPPLEEVEEGEEPSAPLPAAAIARLREEAEKERNKRVAKMKGDHPGMFSALLLRLSAESMQVIRAHADFEEVDLEQNPNRLWTIVRETHLSTVGNVAALAPFQREAIESEMAELRQGSVESIGDFTHRFNIMLARRSSAQLPDYDDDSAAVKFLHKLDPRRHGSMVAHLQNSLQIPATVAEAFTVASNWKVSVSGLAGAGIFFAHADDISDGKTKAGTSKELVAAYDKDKTKKCDNCGKMGHPFFKCPKPLSKELQAKTDAYKLRLAARNRKTKATATVLAIGEEDDGDDIFDSIYMIRAVPDSQARPLSDSHIPSAEAAILEVQQMLDSGAITMIPQAVVAEESTNILAFAGYSGQQPGDIIFDSAAGLDIFAEANLLFNVGPARRAVLLGGFADDSARVRADISGSYRNLGKDILCHPRAKANILSQGRHRDDGHRITYHETTDTYTVVSSNGEDVLLFSRRVQPNGAMGRHYIYRSSDPESSQFLQIVTEGELVNGAHNNWEVNTDTSGYTSDTMPGLTDDDTALDMCADDISDVCAIVARASGIVSTVRENKLMFTKRKVAAADEADRLNINLAFPNPVAFSEAVGRMTGTEITPHDVARREFIYGRQIRSVKGGTKKKASTPAVFEPAPKLLQKQQVLQLDIMFIKEIPFLVGLYLPLDLMVVRPLKAKETAEVDSQLTSMLKVVSPYNIEVSLMQTDGEGAMAVILPLPGHPVSTTGPGQHVHQIERKAMMQYYHSRCADSSLSIVYCLWPRDST